MRRSGSDRIILFYIASFFDVYQISMIDLKDYRKNPEKYHKGAKDKLSQIDWGHFDILDQETREAKLALDEANANRNELTKKIQELQKSGGDFKSVIAQVQNLKGEISSLEETYKTKEEAFTAIVLSIPSPALEWVPVWSEHNNEIMQHIGEKPTFDFEPKTHYELLEAKGWLDQERAVKLSGSRFQIMRGPLAELQLALANRATQKLIKKGFELTLIPQLVKAPALMTTWFLPNDSTNVYRVNPKTDNEQSSREEDDLRLIGTAEVALVSQHMNETLDVNSLPLRYVGYSSCYRRESGTYGKDTKGLIRLHQFEKVEMVTFVKPEDAEKEHELLFAIENEIFQELGLHYQQILIATGDLGAPAAKKYDIEARFAGMDKYIEVTSTSNTTDFQTRRGNIKVKDGKEKYYAYSLNGTAVALSRALACIVETYQTAEGDIRVPECLVKYMGREIL